MFVRYWWQVRFRSPPYILQPCPASLRRRITVSAACCLVAQALAALRKHLLHCQARVTADHCSVLPCSAAS